MLTTLALVTTPASACGGFFCNNVPVDQKGEDIVFAVDEEKGETTVHVQIEYTGAAEEFAWVVPVPHVPELLLSTDALFRELGWRTQPRFGLVYEELWECEYDSTDVDVAMSASSDGGDDDDSGAGGVQVV